MTDTTYNGWTNRETWLVNLHFGIETREDLEYIRDMLEDEVENIGSMFIRDFIDLSKINWYELEQHIEEE